MRSRCSTCWWPPPSPGSPRRRLRIAEEARLRPVSLTVAVHDLVALDAPGARPPKIIWVHRAGSSTDILCLIGPTLAFSRTAMNAEDHTIPDEVRRSIGALRWRGCDAIWFSGDVNPDALGGARRARRASPPGRRAPGPGCPRCRSRMSASTSSPWPWPWAAPVGRVRSTCCRCICGPAASRRPRRSPLGIAAATVLLALGALLVPGFREQRHLSRVNAEISRMDPEVRAVERVVRELERKRKLVATVSGIENAALRPLPVLRELTDLLPTDAWLTTLSLDQKGVELTGQAAAASALIPLLENSSRLERVEFASPVTRGREKEQFRIRAAWEAAPVAATVAPPTPAAGSLAPGARPAPIPIVPGARPGGAQRQPLPPAAQVPGQPAPGPTPAPPAQAPLPPPIQPIAPPAPVAPGQVQPGQPAQSPPGQLAPPRPGATRP